MKMPPTWFLIAATCVLATCLMLPAATPRHALAQSFAPQERMAEVELLLPRSQARPGETLDVGVKFTMQPGWHIYWTNPGDSGQAPTFGWSLPGGGASRMLRGGEWTATAPAFPTPDKFDAGGGLVGYGYSDTIIFPATLTIPASATPGQEVEVTVATKYLICEEICLPEEAVASAKVLLTTAPESDDAKIVKQLKAARDRLPTKSRATADPVAPGHDGPMTFSFDVPRGAKNVQLFPEAVSGINVEDISIEDAGSSHKATYTVRRLAGGNVNRYSIPAVIGYDTRQGRRGMLVQLPIPPADDE